MRHEAGHDTWHAITNRQDLYRAAHSTAEMEMPRPRHNTIEAKDHPVLRGAEMPQRVDDGVMIKNGLANRTSNTNGEPQTETRIQTEVISSMIGDHVDEDRSQRL